MKREAGTPGVAAVVDVETTGFSPYYDEIIELAIVVFRYHPHSAEIIEVVSEYTGLREPSCRIHPGALSVHGITHELVRGLSLDCSLIDGLLKRADFIVAHNAGFDRGFLERLMPSFSNKAWLCSLRGIDWYSKGFSSRSLDDLAEAHKIATPDAHRAGGDVATLLKLLGHRPHGRNTYLHELLLNARLIAKPAKARAARA